MTDPRKEIAGSKVMTISSPLLLLPSYFPKRPCRFLDPSRLLQCLSQCRRIYLGEQSFCLGIGGAYVYMCVLGCWRSGGRVTTYSTYFSGFGKGRNPHVPPHPRPRGVYSDLAQSRLCSQMATACFPHNPCPDPVCTPQPSG